MTGADHRAAVPLRTTYPAAHSVITDVRRELGDWLAAHGFHPETVERARLLISELATNAIEAAVPGGTFDVMARMVDDGVASLSVSNPLNPLAATRPPPREMWGPAEPLALRGRGLAIAAALADAIHVIDDDPATITVAARISDQRAGSRRPTQQEGW